MFLNFFFVTLLKEFKKDFDFDLATYEARNAFSHQNIPVFHLQNVEK